MERRLAHLDGDGLLHRLKQALERVTLAGHLDLDMLRELRQLLQASLQVRRVLADRRHQRLQLFLERHTLQQ